MFDSFFPKILNEPGRPAVYLDCKLNETVAQIFESIGIKKLYKHQAEGIQLLSEGKNIVVPAPTASGKSEIYISAVVEAALKGENSLVIYPTKALARDQLKRFSNFSLYGMRVEIYDGDVAQHKREKIRANPPNVLITNIDMLHFILLHNRLFSNFMKKLKFVVIDELHVYSGIFGSHAANIIDRLKRIADTNNRKLQFIATSATIGNPKEFAEMLIGEEVSIVDSSSAQKSSIIHYIINPEEDSYTTTCIKLLEQIGPKSKTLIFGNSHSVVERLGIMARNVDIPLLIYRSGLSYEKRVEIETAFKTGKSNFIASTSALELGIDIGDIDNVILAGFPGTVNSVKQRIGRSGRRRGSSVGIYVARDNPLDQYYAENSEEYLNGEPERCYLNKYNENIYRMHTLSMAKDRMLTKLEFESRKMICEKLLEQGFLKQWGDFYSITLEGAKLVKKLNIRSIGRSIRIFDVEKQKPIGDREEHMAINELFQGAIYLHGGKTYFSEKLDLENGIAYVKPHYGHLEEYSSALHVKQIEPLSEIASREVFGHNLYYGKVHVVDTTFGFRYKDVYTGRVLSERTFEVPYIYEFDTYAIWFDLEDIAVSIDDFGNGLHAFEHVSIAMMPSFTGADSKELGGMSYPYGRMFVYDGVPEGNGVTKVVFDRFEKAVEMAYERLKDCKCEKGCPKCVLDAQCGNDNNYLNKISGLEIAKNLLGVK